MGCTSSRVMRKTGSIFDRKKQCSGTSAWQGSDYTSHDALIDGIHERSSFNDPYSGQQLSRDGQYDYWYQNNLGEYHGTNDPSFDTHALQGNWQQIDPLTPNP